MSHESLKTAVGTVLAMSLSGGASADPGNPFELTDLGYGAPVLAEAKCGAKAGNEGKCGGTKGETGASAAEDIPRRVGGIGAIEGIWGTERVRELMDANDDDMVSRSEFMTWTNRQASRHFEQIDLNEDGIVDVGEMEAYFTAER